MNDYEQRIIVFMDILGFKRHILNTIQNIQCKNNIFKVMKYIKYMEHDNYEGLLRQADIGREVTIFSDSIVISYPCNMPSALFYILIDIVHIQLELVSSGIILRGGVSLGPVYHNKNIVFGPAMVDAYTNESIIAKVPRIIIPKEIIDYAIDNLPLVNEKRVERNYIMKLLKLDIDGYFFTDFLSQPEELDCMEYYIIILESLKYNIVNTLKNIDDSNVRQKYEWLKAYYNEVVQKIPQYRELLID